jgi:cag pathogenicity island protein 24
VKYRLLTSEELASLEKEFINFLVSNTITADDWLHIKATEQERAAQLIEIFSDMVLERSLQKIEYVERKTAHEVHIYYFGPQECVLVGIRVDPSLPVDLTEADAYPKVTVLLEQSENPLAKVFSTRKEYTLSREEDLFAMLESGGLITHDRHFKLLQSLITHPEA